jgi:hypothetical protein
VSVVSAEGYFVSNIPPINHESRRLDASVVGVVFMKKLVLTAVALIALLSVSGCVGIGKGKGKAPPDVPPIMTKG